MALSLLLHLGFLGLMVLAALRRERPPEPLPPPAYAVYYESGAPDRPGEPDLRADEPAPAEVAPPPQPPDFTPPLPPEAIPPPPPPPPALAEAVPPPVVAEPLPIPPPPLPESRPQAQAALVPPPRPAQPSPPAPADRLPGLYLPEGLTLAPAQRQAAPPPRQEARRRGLDLSLGGIPAIGRATPEPQAEVRGAQVGPDWRNAFRRWLEEHKRYPEAARELGEEGTTRIELVVAPDGQVRSMRLLRRSGSVWLDAGTLSLFRGAVLPPFPPGADPSGVTVDLTIHYVLIRN